MLIEDNANWELYIFVCCYNTIRNNLFYHVRRARDKVGSYRPVVKKKGVNVRDRVFIERIIQLFAWDQQLFLMDQ